MSIFQEFIVNNKEKGNLYLKVLGLIFILFMGVTLGEIIKSGERLTYNEIKTLLLIFWIVASILGLVSIFVRRKNKNL